MTTEEHKHNAFTGVVSHEGLKTGDGREVKEPVPFQLKTVVLRGDPLNDMQSHLRRLLDALNSVPGLVKGEAFTLSIDHVDFDTNECKLVLEFERG